jgi:restriction system protein
LDEKYLTMFIDSVLLEYANSHTSPMLLIHAIITPYAANSEGKLVRALAVPWQMIVSHLKRDWSLAYQMPYEKWEEMVAAAFDRAGYDEVILMPWSWDHGRDVIAIKKGIGSVRIIDSVKAHKPGHLVKHDDVERWQESCWEIIKRQRE